MEDPETGDQTDSILNPKQERAILALMEQPTLKQAAAAAGVNPATLWRWLQTDDFRRAYLEVRRKAVQQSMARLQSLTSDVASVLGSIMKDTSAPHYTRVAACNSVMRNAVKGVELEDHDVRLNEIKRDLDSIKPRK
jgi:hypothetical protein